MIATKSITRRLRHEINRRLPRRIDLGPEDSAAFRAEIEQRNDRWVSTPRLSLDMGVLIPERGPYKFKGVPVRLDQPETRFIRWDDYEQLQVLSATCFTPDPK